MYSVTIRSWWIMRGLQQFDNNSFPLRGDFTLNYFYLGTNVCTVQRKKLTMKMVCSHCGGVDILYTVQCTVYIVQIFTVFYITCQVYSCCTSHGSGHYGGHVTVSGGGARWGRGGDRHTCPLGLEGACVVARFYS